MGMTREEKIICKEFLNDADNTHSCNEYKLLMGLLEQEPTTKNDLGVDCISRDAARNAIIGNQYSNSFCEEHNIDHSIHTSMALIALSDLPSVTPQEPKIGHWEWVKYDSNPNLGNWHCSECKTIIPHMPEEADNTPVYKYCPNCGARMIESYESESQESEDNNGNDET